jgi:hypothetical protein
MLNANVNHAIQGGVELEIGLKQDTKQYTSGLGIHKLVQGSELHL